MSVLVPPSVRPVLVLSLAAVALPAPAAAQGMASAMQARQLKAQGDQARKAKKLDEAEALYKQALQAAPGLSEAADALGRLYLKKKRYAEAEAVFLAAIKANPNYHKGIYRLAYARRKAGKLREAAEAYVRYTKVQPKDPDGYYGLGEAWVGLNEKGRAIRAYTQYLKLERRPSEAKWRAKARDRIVSLGGTPPPEGPAPDPLAAARPAAAPAMARPPAKAAKPAPPAKVARPARPAKPKPPPRRVSSAAVAARIAQGDRAFERGDLRSAMEAYAHAMAGDSRSVEARYKLGVTQAAAGEFDRAATVFEQVLELAPKLETARRYLVETRLRHAEKTGAGPASPQGEGDALLSRARAHVRDHEYALAHGLLERARATGAPAAECDRLDGEALLAQGELAAAAAAFERAVGRGSEGVRAHAGLARVRARQGDWQRAAYHLRLFLDLLRAEPMIGALEEASAERALKAMQARLEAAEEGKGRP